MATTIHHHDPEPCAPCDIGPFSRNNFFTGKLLLERDFTDEQAYTIDKLRHHNRRLHGWGVVCGLRVKQHPTPGCRDTRCLPNRILESFELDVTVDPQVSADMWDGPQLVRGADIGFADATRLVWNPGDGLLYVLAGTTVHAVDPSSHAILRSHDLGSSVHSLDLSPNRTHLYAVRDKDGGGLTLTVLQASDFAVTHEEDVPDGQTPVTTAVSPAADGRFLVLVTGAASLVVYGSDLE